MVFKWIQHWLVAGNTDLCQVNSCHVNHWLRYWTWRPTSGQRPRGLDVRRSINFIWLFQCYFTVLVGLQFIFVLYTVSQKSIPDIFDCNLKTHYQILIIFGTNIPETTCHQLMIQFPTSPNVCFCTTCGKHNQRNITKLNVTYPMRYDCLIMRKNTFCSHFWHFGWHFIQFPIFQLPVVKLCEVLAHCVNTGKEMLSPFINSSIDNVLFQTNPGSTSRFLTSQTFLNFIW